jgi:hypothetical protein
MLDDLAVFQRHFADYDPDDPAAFRRLLSEGTKILGLKPSELSELFDVSVPGAEGWLGGTMVPDSAVRTVVIDALAARVARGSAAVSRSLEQTLAHH